MLSLLSRRRFQRPGACRDSDGVHRASLLLMSMLAVTLAGCRPNQPAADQPPDSQQTAADSAGPDAAAEDDPDAILRRMVKAYRDTPSYADQGRVLLHYRQRGDIVQDEAPLAVASIYPGRLRVAAYHAMVVCDGDKLYARITDEPSGDLDGQVLVRTIASGEVTLALLYSDTVLRDAMTSGLGRRPIQLDLLLSDDPLAEILSDKVTRRLLSAAKFAEQDCYRVEATTDEGPFVFWIDQEMLLRRLDYPVEAILPELAANPEVRDLRLSAEFRDARFKPAEDDASFSMTLPESRKEVAALVLPPAPLPSQLFGQRPRKFEFHTVTGDRVAQNDLDGSNCVLLWFNSHPACRETLQQLSQVAAEQDDDKLKIYAVATDPSEISTERLKGLLRQWQVELPMLRDVLACGRDVFDIPWAPSLIVLDEEGAVQIFQVGANPDLGRELPVILDRLRGGTDLAAEILDEHAEQKDEYQRLLQLAQRSTDPEVIELAMAKIKPRSEPRKTKLTPLWSITELPAPGNICVFRRADQASTLLVVDSGASIVEVDMAGQIIGRHELELEGDRVAAVRAAEIDGQPRYLASALQGQFAYLFDADWKPVLRYPSAEQRHAGISDFRLADLAADGTLDVLIGFAGEVGVHSVAADGGRAWSNRAMPNVLSLAVTGEDDAGRLSLLVTGESGDILTLDATGKQASSTDVAGLSVFHLFSGAPPEAATPYCGFTYSQSGNLFAFGLSDEFREVWSYPLPAGTFRNPIEFAAAGNLSSQPYWCLAAPDGTIPWIRADGQAADFFAYGSELTGLALVEDVLVVASRQDLAAWRLEME